MSPLIAALALLTLAVVAILVWPLLRRPGKLIQRADFDRAVYSDQLLELDRDLTRGLIGPQEAVAARLEIQRRILATGISTEPGPAPARASGSPRLAMVLVLLVTASAAGLYLRLGAPGVPSVPYASRVLPPSATQQASAQSPASPGSPAAPDAPHDTKSAAEKLAQKLRADPNNAEGWLLYARTESTLGDWDKAIDGYRHALALGQTGADAFAGYGEMLVLSQQGIISPAARDAFNAAQKADKTNEVARFYLALADSQAGEAASAIKAWLSLAADITDDSPMRPEIARRVAEAAQSAGMPVPALPKGLPPMPEAAADQSGPTPEQMEAATQMAPAERDKMIGGMIAQLAAKLQANPNDLDGWMRLGRAYAVQGETDKAVDAYDHASKLKPDDADIKLQAAATILARLKPNDALPTRAVSLLQEAAAGRPEAPEVLWYLGIIAAREGHADIARRNWSKLLTALNKDGEDYRMVQAALADLRTP